MIVPIRCFSCGKPIGHLWEKYNERIRNELPKKVMDDLGLERVCCRGVFLGHVDLQPIASRFKKF